MADLYAALTSAIYFSQMLANGKEVSTDDQRIKPDNPQTWANFWRPLHGKSPETARPWVQPKYGTTDMYHAGECMVYTDGNTYKCLSDTVYSPEEYGQAWEVV